MQWKTIKEETVSANQWFKLNRADVELPDGRHLDHFLLRQPPVGLVAIINEHDQALLLWRHRFIPDSWGWELPSGKVEDGEAIASAAAREAFEETGWKPRNLRHLVSLEVSSGFSDACHHVYWTDEAEYVGPPQDAYESDRIEWVPLADVPALVAKGQIRAANTVAALLALKHIQRAA